MAALGLGTALFHGLGSGPLEAPPPDPGGWGDWADGKDPLVATIALLRLVALALSWYLVGATTVGIVARLMRAAQLIRVADALTVPMLRRLLQGALGLSLATAMVAAAVPAGSTGVGRPETVATSPAGDTAQAGQAGPGGDPSTVSLTARSNTATLRQVADQPDSDGEAPDDSAGKVTLGHTGSGPPLPLQLTDDAAPPTTDQQSSDAATGVAAGPDSDGSPGSHVVVAGESLWSIARDALADAWARSPSDAEVVGYWRALIETNRGELDDPDNPDLIFPGQVFSLPPLPGS